MFALLRFQSAQDRMRQLRPRQRGSFPSALEIIIRSLLVDPMDEQCYASPRLWCSVCHYEADGMESFQR